MTFLSNESMKLNGVNYTLEDIEKAANLLAEYSQKLESLYKEYNKRQDNFIKIAAIARFVVYVFGAILFLLLILPIPKRIFFVIFLVSLIPIVIFPYYCKTNIKEKIYILNTKEKNYILKNVSQEVSIMRDKFERLVRLCSQLQENFVEKESILSIELDLRLLEAERVLRKVRGYK